jgi:hypothetical protein
VFVCYTQQLYIDKTCDFPNELETTIGHEDLLFAPAVMVAEAAAGT